MQFCGLPEFCIFLFDLPEFMHFYPSIRVVLMSKINSSSRSSITTIHACSHCLHSQLYSPASLSATTLNACWAQQKLPSPFSCFTNHPFSPLDLDRVQSQTLCCYCTASCTLGIQPLCTPCLAAYQTLLCMLALAQPESPITHFFALSIWTA